MSILHQLPLIASCARETWERGTIPANLWFEAIMDRYAGVRSGVGGGPEPGKIIRGDNLSVAKTLFAAVSAGTQGAPTLIYMDPPFFTRSKYKQNVNIPGDERGGVTLPVKAFSDMWGGADGAGTGDAFARYLEMLSVRIVAAHDLLSDEGSLWIHLDHHAAHYVKILADHIFGGPEYLLNEVIWQYSSGGATKKHFARKHDTLLFYAKNPVRHRFYPMREKSYNRGRKPYRFKGVKEYRDEGGWYTLVNMRDVWRIDMVGRTSGERTGYATQKPEALMERIVSSCTERGDLCLDMFGGSGTLAAVCESTDRRWIVVDESPLASLHIERRMAGKGAAFEIMSGARTVAEPAAEGAPSWGLEAALEHAADGADGAGAMAVVKPVSYTMPEGALDVGVRDASALAEKIRRSPGSFVAGMSAEVRPAPGGDGPFRPSCAVYGEGSLRLPVRDSDAEIIVRVVDVFGNVSIVKMNEE